jgi:3-methyladenine DNA glycosylase AlkD
MSANFKKQLAEVEALVANTKPQRSKLNPASYIGGGVSSYQYAGLSVPQIRSIYKNSAFSFRQKNPESKIEEIKTWDYIWQKSKVFEVACLPLMHMSDGVKKGELLAAHLPVLEKWAYKIDNWAHSDSLSSIYVRILEADRKAMLPILEGWSASKNPWLRRQSIVSLLYYSSARKNILPFGKLIGMVKKQMLHEHYYVQKGVGWTLREIGNVYPSETFNFLEENIGAISAAAFTAATEKLSSTKKNHLKKLRAVAKGPVNGRR